MIDRAAKRVPLPEAPPEPEKPQLVRLDLACGQRKKEGFLGVDIGRLEGVDFPGVDLFKFPWPFEDGAVDEVHSAHFFEHVPAELRLRFFDELYRVLKVGSRAQIVCPYYNSSRASQDPTHCWPPISEGSFLYANKGWRESNGLSHYGVSCDFDFVFGYTYYPDWESRSEDARAFAQKHYTNVVMDIHVSLVKR
jgi:SAM-dependent methyltransferase